jgi:replicative DNA helicase
VGYKIDEIKKYIKESKVKPDMVILDYLNKIYSNPGQSRLESINHYLREFSLMAKEMNFCGVVCCQINREAMGTGNTKEVLPPMLHHLKDSGEIEQIADLVVFLHWKYKYTGDTMMDKNVIDVIVAKNKDGETGIFQCHISPEYNRISNLDKNSTVVPVEHKPVQETLK